jgi:hypothetical protein
MGRLHGITFVPSLRAVLRRVAAQAEKQTRTNLMFCKSSQTSFNMVAMTYYGKLTIDLMKEFSRLLRPLPRLCRGVLLARTEWAGLDAGYSLSFPSNAFVAMTK